jgi:hypothetical protein
MATKYGISAANTISGTSSADTIWGRAGNDTFKDLGGNDKLYGGDGTDLVDGNTGVATASAYDSGINADPTDRARNPMSPSRLSSAAAVAALFAAVATLVAPAAAAEVNSPILSSLSWRSGSSCPEKGLATCRGRALDANVAFAGSHETWDAMLKHVQNSWFRNLAKASPQFVISLGMLPKSAAKQFAACARGDFDGYFRQFGSIFARIGAGQAVVRLGWEANKTRPWSPTPRPTIPDYVACFQREAAALKSTAPSLKIEWTMGRISAVPFNVMDMYPATSTSTSSGCTTTTTSARRSRPRRPGTSTTRGPTTAGRGARHVARGRQVARQEAGGLGVGGVGPGRPGEGRQPGLRREHVPVLPDNAADIAYENYYNCPLVHQLYPSTRFTKARAKYQEAWAAGQ